MDKKPETKISEKKEIQIGKKKVKGQEKEPEEKHVVKDDDDEKETKVSKDKEIEIGEGKVKVEEKEPEKTPIVKDDDVDDETESIVQRKRKILMTLRDKLDEEGSEHFSSSHTKNSHGSRFKYSLDSRATAFVDANLIRDSECFAICGNSTVMIIDSEEHWTGHEIPRSLSVLLSTTASKPLYVTLGSMGRWYVEFADGSSKWTGCADMDEELFGIETREEKPCWVAFGKHWDSYFIIYDSGEWCCSNIPEELDQEIGRMREEPWSRPAIKCVALGPKGEYFLSAFNRGRLRKLLGGITMKQMEKIASIKDRIIFIDFGENDTYMARYDDRPY